MSSSKRISVIMLIDSWFPSYGGGQVHVRELSKALKRKYGCRIKIFHPANTHIISRGLWSILVVPQVLFLTNKLEIDIIHSHGYIAGLPAKLLSLIFQIPVVHTVHGSSLLDQNKKGTKAILEKYLLTKIKYSAQITVSSNFLTHPNINHNLHVISNGVNTPAFDSISVKKNKLPTLIWVGRSDPVKGFKYLRKAVLLIIKQIPNLKTQFVTGNKIYGRKLIKAYKKSHVFVLPSLAEGQPITLLEAWAAKLPVVVTKVGDNPNTVKNNVNGILVDPKNSQQLAKAVTKILKNSKRAKKMGLAGYKLVKYQYSWQKSAQSTFAIYQNLLQLHPNQQISTLSMPLDKDLLKILACPDDKANVKYKKAGKKETLTCTKCKRVFQIKDGIPIMLPKDAG